MKRMIAVAGGDLRMARLAELLLDGGCELATWGLEGADAPNPVPLDKALEAGIIVLPLPLCRDGMLTLPLTDETLACERLWPRLKPSQIVLGGQLGDLPERLKNEYGLNLVDYFARDEVQAANAVPTAEGAIALAMGASERTVWESRCLVTGAGRIGRTLAWRLSALGAKVSVSARRQEDLAWIRVWGCEALRTDGLDGLDRFDFIFNTVPSLVLDCRLLAQVRRDCPLMELASPPGGIDREAAVRLGLRFIAAPGLPGKAAPLTAAEVIRDSIYHILKERGEPI